MAALHTTVLQLLAAATLLFTCAAHATPPSSSLAWPRPRHAQTLPPGTTSDPQTTSLTLDPQCPSLWQPAYTLLHNTILAKDPSLQQLVVFDAVDSGLSDRMFSALTAFYYALLTRRAFKIIWRGPYRLELAHSQPNINWTFSELDLETATLEGRVRAFDFHAMSDKTGLQQLYRSQDLLLHAGDTRVIKFTNNQGQVNLLFNNPHHKYQLEEWGLRPETAIGCAYNYLFSPTDNVLNSIQQPLRTLANRPPSTVVIAIQIRHGDSSLEPSHRCRTEPTEAKTKAFFTCAQQLEDEINASGAFKVYWLLVTDCIGLRETASSLFGKKLLTETKVELDHSLKSFRHNISGFYSSFGESWALGMADYHVISKGSAFGRLGALRSLRFRNVFTIENSKGRRCHLNDYDVFRDVAEHWVHV